MRWTVELVVLGAMLVTVGAYQTRNHPRGRPPDVALSTLDGKPVRLAQYAGKPTLVAVWAPWCGVCKMDGDNISRVRGWLGATRPRSACGCGCCSSADQRRAAKPQARSGSRQIGAYVTHRLARSAPVAPGGRMCPF